MKLGTSGNSVGENAFYILDSTQGVYRYEYVTSNNILLPIIFSLQFLNTSFLRCNCKPGDIKSASGMTYDGSSNTTYIILLMHLLINRY